MESSKTPSKALIGLIVVVLLVAAATAVIVLSSNNKSATQDTAINASDLPTNAPSVSPSNDVVDSSPTTKFKDGTYSAKATYDSPGGQESIDVTVTLADDTVTNVSATPHANVSEAEEYQSKFISGYKSKVVGKKINEISLSRVAGSSLTSIGFNKAIDEIEKQAQQS